MLKALELSGFKSFADKTRFEFPPGITVIVGPNGSGKSNIVDAIKWVLGEQSAKSLRGKDMSDVIFKGSGGDQGRKPANAATATIVLDNSDKRFAFDADEVLVSRRVYRSGESEYLINGETSRLKDIRELFRGTGVGTDAYSLIEQGKVERMLSTNAKDRRAIFEEAAGISRFKAKKKDAQRRLARVDGNLIRLADIVEEVGSRYRSVKSQASKAARFKEYSDRLQQLRTHVGTKDWRQFSEKLDAIQDELAQFENSSTSLESRIAEFEKQSKAVETKLDAITQSQTDKQQESTTVRESIARAESTLELNQSRLADIESRNNQLNEQLKRAKVRVDEAQRRIEKSESDSENAELEFREASDRLKELEAQLDEVNQRTTSITTGNEAKRSQQKELADIIVQLGRNISSAETETNNLSAATQRLSESLELLKAKLQTAQQEKAAAESAIQQLEQEAASKNSALAESREQLDSVKSELDGRRQRLTELARQHAGMTQRAEVIEELEKSLEGINAGAKELLKHAQEPKGPMTEVIGLVADLVAVNVQHAALVDVALGDIAQFVLVRGEHLINEIAAERIKLNGRVGLIQLDSPPSLGTDPTINLNGETGVIGRADRLVQVKPEHADFIRNLLGGTWVVKTLGVALHLHHHHAGADRVRFVSLDGEVVEADGSVVVGPKSTTTGLVSRRSELRALTRETGRLGDEITTCEEQIKQLSQREQKLAKQVDAHLNENSDLAAKLSQQNSKLDSASSIEQETSRQLDTVETDLKQDTDRFNLVQTNLANDQKQLELQELAIAQVVELLNTNDTEAAELNRQRSQIEKATTVAKVKLAKAEQVLETVQTRVQQLRSEYEEQVDQQKQLLNQSTTDKDTAQLAHEEIKTANEQLANFRISNEEIDDVLSKINDQRLELDAQRRSVATELRGQQDQLRLVKDKIHDAKMRLEQIGSQRQQLAEKMREDYGIEIADLGPEAEVLTEEEQQQRDQIDQEITELRKKIASIGSVNLDALQELEELESRYLSMDAQYQDLVHAKETLEKIIVRIDADSRKLFVETLEAIRTNFQKLFRQTFGGGKADILLEPDIDPLEAGVEIVATPPGKPEFSNSLLSGGEKALTAVSLLMAIFQFRPSPFCVLDEVDAPFDEANIGRFIDVLKSFLGWTKFVIVTHSKKTMTAATTLYGITMQESGVSKRVSVRFEDVSDDGHISPDAIRRNEDDAA
ncbi:MAG: chromosome segregation protein SMC [Planctomycetota bacterium]